MQKRQSKGFTIVELAIVVTIIGLLAAMAIAGYIKIRQVAQDRTVLNNLRQIAQASQMYMHEEGAASVSVSDLYGIYLQTPEQVAGETYPSVINLGDTQIEATGIAGTRTVTYVF